MKSSILLLTMTAATGLAAPPFVMFPTDAAYTDTAIIPVTAKYLLPMDFIGYQAALKVPELSRLVPAAHTMLLSPTVQSVQTNAGVNCSETPGIIVYEPAVNIPVGSLAAVVQTIKASGCRQSGFMPAGAYFGLSHCAANLQESTYRSEDWSKVDYLVIPGGGLLDDQCIGKTGVADYVSVAQTVAAYVRERNPKVAIVAHLSFRNAQPGNMVAAAKALTGIVDGFLLAYPIYSEHRYCTAPNLQTFLSALRP